METAPRSTDEDRICISPQYRSIFYPYKGNSRALPGRSMRAKLFPRVQKIGFDGIELVLDMLGGAPATESQVREIREELESYGTPCVVL